VVRRNDSMSTVHRTWKTFGLQPHRIETFKLSTDPLFVEYVRDIVGLYPNPAEPGVVLCIDEKSQIQALKHTQPLLAMHSKEVEQRTHDYTCQFAALDVSVDKVTGRRFMGTVLFCLRYDDWLLRS
jgi:hypothetical protein